MTVEIVSLSPIYVPENAPISRSIPRPKGQRQEGFYEQFDYKTLFFDVFNSHNRVILSGPPLRNLSSIVRIADIKIDGRDLGAPPRLKDLRLTQQSWIESSNATWLSISAGKLNAQVRVQPNLSYLLSNKKVLFTLSKDNNLHWIFDWAKFYVEEHGVEAVVLYDNGSSRYGIHDIAETLDKVIGLSTIILVNWPFKYGPSGGPEMRWDSHFCQFGMIEHARRRLLSDAKAVVNADIDELLIVEGGRTIFDRLEEEPSGAISYYGRWIEALTAKQGDNLSFRDYRLYDPERERTPRKWAAVPSRFGDDVQWTVHYFEGAELPVAQDASYRHFRGINTNWKVNRNRETRPNTRHAVDVELDQRITRIFY